MGLKPNLFLELLEKGSLRFSRVSGVWESRAWVNLKKSGLVDKVRRGGGEVVFSPKPESLRDWIKVKFPSAFGALEASSVRASNIADGRDSKAGRRKLDHVLVLARAFRLDPSLEGDAALAMANLVEATRRWGAVTIKLDLPAGGGAATGPALPMGIRVMTVENQENQFNLADMVEEAEVFLQCGTGGKMSTAMIAWLAAQEGLQVIHFGDYDPTGLQEFLRLREAMPGRVTLFLPGGIAALIRDYSNRGLLDAERNSNLFGELKTRARGLDPALDRVLDLINAHGPLEQEAMLIRGTAGDGPCVGD